MKSVAERLEKLGFVFLGGGSVILGTDEPTPCRLEGLRRNETPVREVMVRPFWIAKFTVTNAEFREFGPKFVPSLYSSGPKHPVTNVTYLNALSYVEWLSEKHGLEFALPTEAQWCFAAAPYGWKFTTGRDKPNPFQVKVWDKDEIGAVAVDDPRYPPNWCGLKHMGGNVWEMVLGAHYIEGSNQAATDGMVVLVKGGGFFHCPLSTGTCTRGVFDVAFRCSEIGFRVACSYVPKNN